MTEITHEEAFAELSAVALDSADAEVSAAVRAHASACPDCGPELAAMEQTIAVLGHLVPPAQLNPGRSAGIRSRLVMRGRGEREVRSAPLPGRPDLARGVASLTGLGHKATPTSQQAITQEDVGKRASPRWTAWLAIAATAAFIATSAQLMRVTADRNQIREQLAGVDTLAPVADSLEAMVNRREAMIAAMAGPDVHVVPLTNALSRLQGKMTWNRASNDWVIVTYGLRPPREGMTYQVWLVTDTGKISAGTFRPDRDGGTVMHANYALPRDALRAVAVTEEPEGGMPAPTGPTVISGSG